MSLRKLSSLITLDTTISASSMPSSKYKRLLPVLIAAKPTPKVMPMKYLPSRVTRSLRGGRHQARRPSRLGGELGLRSGRVLLTPEGTARAAPGATDGGTDSGRAGVESPALDSREEELVAMCELEWYGHSPDDVPHHTFRFFAAGYVTFGVCGQPHAVREQRYCELLNVVSDTVPAAVQESAGASGLG